MIINPTSITVKTNIKVIFKSPRVGEGEILLAYFKKLFEQSSRFFIHNSDFYSKQSSDVQESFIKAFAEDNHSFAIFAYIDDTVVGHIVIHNQGAERTKHRATLMMGVLEEWQNNGIGKALLSLAIEEASKINILSIELRVRDFNEMAIKLYADAGFTEVGVIQGAARVDNVFVSEYIFVRNSQELLNQLTHINDSSLAKLDDKQKIKLLEDKIASLELQLADMKKKVNSSAVVCSGEAVRNGRPGFF